MTKESSVTQSIRKEANRWLVAKNSGTWSETDQHALDVWLAKDRLHRQYYLQMQQLWLSMDAYKDQDFPQRQAALQYHSQIHLDNVVNFPGLTDTDTIADQPATKTARWPTQWLKTGGAVAASLLMVLGIQTYQQTGVEHYQTEKGEQKTIFMVDGTQIVLNTDTEMKVDLQLFERKVLLSRGEALFKVSHNPLRPFEVTAGNGRIRDIGTRFDVHAQANWVDVAVLEGEVSITTRIQQAALKAGQAATYDANGQLVYNIMPNPQVITAWEQGKLMFVDQPLVDVLTQIARYHSVEFQIDDAKLRQMKISGTFKTANLRLLLETLEAGFPINTQFIDYQHVRLQRQSR